MAGEKIAVVTGANKGIGFQICYDLAKMKGIRVVLTSRDEKKGKDAQKKLKEKGVDVDYLPLDVSKEESVDLFVDMLKKNHGRCDILVNNAGIFPDTAEGGSSQGVLGTNIDTVKRAMQTNVYGPMMLCQRIVPMMKKQKFGRIVNMSSGMGQLSEMNGGYPAYRISKTSLNALTKTLSEDLKGENILVNTMCPGWVKTDMGGPNATRPVEKGAETAVFLATLPDNGPTGKFFRDKKEFPW